MATTRRPAGPRAVFERIFDSRPNAGSPPFDLDHRPGRTLRKDRARDQRDARAMTLEAADRHLDVLDLRLPAEEAPSSRARRFLEYWQSLPKDGLVPRRDLFDPVAVAPLLSDLIICRYEFGASPKVCFTLIGSRHVDRWGRDLTGQDYLAFVPEIDRAATWHRLRLVVEHPCGTHGFRAEIYRSGKVVLLESLILPLRGGDGRVDRCIAYSHEAPGYEKPRWDISVGREFRATSGGRYLDIGNGVPPGEEPCRAA